MDEVTSDCALKDYNFWSCRDGELGTSLSGRKKGIHVKKDRQRNATGRELTQGKKFCLQGLASCKDSTTKSIRFNVIIQYLK